MNKDAYIEWFNKARRNGVVEDAVRAYYIDSGVPLYRAETGDGSVVLPLTTQTAWQDSDKAHIHEEVQQMQSDYDEDVIDKRLRWVAAQSNGTVDSFSGGIHNGTTLRPLKITQSERKIVVGRRDYLTQLANHERSVQEIGEALWESNVQPDAHGTRLDSIVPTLPLPRRDNIGGTLSSILDSLPEQCGYFGVHAATVVNTGGHYEVLSVGRAADALAYPQRRGTVPSGNIEPRETDAIERQMLLEEFVEEVMVTEWEDADNTDSEAMQAFHKARQDGRIRLSLTGMQLGLVGPDLTMNGVIIVEDTDFYENYIKDNIAQCSEHAAVHTRPVADAEQHDSFMRNKNVPAVHRAAQHEALCHLDIHSDIDVPQYGRSMTE